MALGEAWGAAAQPGWVIGLVGDLGAGKTQLVKGIARGLGIPGVVHSPTFALVHVYEAGRWPLFHVDLYRLETAQQLQSAGIEEYLHHPAGVTVIEWFDRWWALDPRLGGALGRFGGFWRRATLEAIGDSERRIGYEDFGA